MTTMACLSMNIYNRFVEFYLICRTLRVYAKMKIYAIDWKISERLTSSKIECNLMRSDTIIRLYPLMLLQVNKILHSRKIL